MKLWKKISIICVMVLILTVCACSSVLLIKSKNDIIDSALRQAENKQKNLCASFKEMANYYLNDEYSKTARNSLKNYCFSRFADRTSVLMEGSNVIYSGVTILPTDYISCNKYGDTDVYLGMIEDRNIVIVGNQVSLRDGDFIVATVEDITTVYNSIVQMTWFFAVVSIFGIVAGSILIVILMKKITKPLSELSKATRKIAKGEYSMRVNIRTNDEIGALSEDFDIMADAVERHVCELKDTAERQQLFINGVTHEFKTPLTALMLHANMLRSANMNDAERELSLEHIETQCKWLERLVQSLLKLITLKQEVNKEPIKINELFERVKDTVQKRLNDSGINLKISGSSDIVNVDADLMHSLIVNLIDNAAKSYDEDSKEKIVEVSYKNNAIAVKDKGRGIAKEDLSRIFEPFYMVDKSRSRKKGGIGLGLAIVKIIAEAHGASVTVESEYGKGSAFYIRL